MKLIGIFCTIILSGIGLFFLVTSQRVYRFLSDDHPVAAQVLVVQGWVVGPWIKGMVTSEIERGGYKHIIITGTEEEVVPAKELLIENGISQEIISSAVIINKKKQHRTFHEAFGLKYYLEDNMPGLRAVNVVTASIHGKKTHIIFKKVLGDSLQVGIITGKRGAGDPSRWRRSLPGIKKMVKYSIGYLYAVIWNMHIDRAAVLK